MISGLSSPSGVSDVDHSPNMVHNEKKSIFNGVDQILNIDDVVADNEDYGDTDSVETSIEINDLTECYFETYKERINVLVKEEDDGEEAVSGCEHNWIMKKGINDVSIPLPPDDWVTPEPKKDKGEPIFSEVDNPGDWPSFTYRAKFDKSGKYEYHHLPTGATPVPIGKDGVRKCKEWNFYYNG